MNKGDDKVPSNKPNGGENVAVRGQDCGSLDRRGNYRSGYV